MRLLTIALLSACGIDPFETPSAYDQQRFRCGENLPDLETAANDCLDADPERCAGYISFQGQIQRVHLTVDTKLERGVVPPARNEDGEQVMSRVEISGAAPYFHFDTAISSIGTPWPYEAPPPPEEPYTVLFDDPNSHEAPDLEDDRGAVSWYIRAGSDTAMLSSNRSDDDKITVTRVSDDRVDLQFAGPIGPVDDYLDACAIVFPQGPPAP